MAFVHLGSPSAALYYRVWSRGDWGVPRHKWRHFVVFTVSAQTFGTPGLRLPEYAGRSPFGLLVKSVSRPQYRNDMSMAHAWNRKFGVPKKTEYGEVRMEIYDTYDGAFLKLLVEWLRNFNNDQAFFEGDQTSGISRWSTIQSGHRIPPATPVAYGRRIPLDPAFTCFFETVDVYELGPYQGNRWVMRNAWVQDLSFGDNDYGSDDGPITISMTLSCEAIQWVATGVPLDELFADGTDAGFDLAEPCNRSLSGSSGQLLNMSVAGTNGIPRGGDRTLSLAFAILDPNAHILSGAGTSLGAAAAVLRDALTSPFAALPPTDMSTVQRVAETVSVVAHREAAPLREPESELMRDLAALAETPISSTGTRTDVPRTGDDRRVAPSPARVASTLRGFVEATSKGDVDGMVREFGELASLTGRVPSGGGISDFGRVSSSARGVDTEDVQRALRVAAQIVRSRSVQGPRQQALGADADVERVLVRGLGTAVAAQPETVRRLAQAAEGVAAVTDDPAVRAAARTVAGILWAGSTAAPPRPLFFTGSSGRFELL